MVKTSEELLRLDALSKYYTGAQSVAMGLNSISLTLCRGEFVAVTGESGSGKSTLAQVLGGLLPYEGGELYFGGEPTSHFDGADYERYRRDNVSYISQSYGVLPGVSVMQNVVSALRFCGVERAEAAQRAESLLREVELWEERSRRASKLSSGQKQRLAIARALAKPAPVLIADEPTGNLDAANGARVIELLARAARSRLVVLVTHDFAEAEKYATRRVSLHDGQVLSDLALRPSAPGESAAPEERVQPRGGGVSRALGAYAARLQLGGRPVWSALVALFFALTAFAVFAFLGTFVISVDDTPTRIYDPSAFQNGGRERIAVLRGDLGLFTEADFEKILSAEYVESLEPWGYVADINYAWREGVDYEYKYSAQSDGDEDNFYMQLYTSVRVLDSAPFMQTVPLLAGDREFLTAGRVPESLFEVVAAGDASLIGTRMPVFLRDTKNWSASVKINLEVEVVGVTDCGEGLFFHSDFGKAFSDYFLTPGGNDWLALYAPDLAEGEARFSSETYSTYLRQGVYSFGMPLASVPTDELDRNDPTHWVNLRLLCEQNGNLREGVSPTHSSFYTRYLELSRADFERVVGVGGGSDQVSVTISDYAYTDRVLEALRDMGYIALSPFREGSTRQSAALAAEREQTLVVCAAALLAATLLQVTVLRALFSAQTESYALMRDIGLARRAAKRSVYLQVLLFTVLGQLLAAMAVAACARLGLERIAQVLRYLPPPYIAASCALHLAAAAVAAVWTSRAMERRVFVSRGRVSDLALDGEEAAL